LNGLHLEQYRHATYDPLSYYQEAIRREPADIRSNNAMGAWFLRRAQPTQAEPFLRQAVKSLQLRNPNPYDGEPLYNLGLCLKMLGRDAEAFDAFYKSTWNDAWQHNGFLQLARLACKSDFEEGLDLINKSLNRNYTSPAARHLKAAILRKLERMEEAKVLIAESLEMDPFNLGVLFEQALVAIAGNTTTANNRATADLVRVEAIFHQSAHPVRNAFNNYAEYALDYAEAGMFDEAHALLTMYKPLKPEPLLNYYLGWFCLNGSSPDKAQKYFDKAAAAPADYCFPSKVEEVRILRAAGRAGCPGSLLPGQLLVRKWKL
ncbi:MAG: DUF5107 domain-containing protein, partial [Sphingobacteriales bacterium]